MKPQLCDYVLMATDKEYGSLISYDILHLTVNSKTIDDIKHKRNEFDYLNYAYHCGIITEISKDAKLIRTSFNNVFVHVKDNIYKLKGSGFSYMIKELS